MSGTVNAFYNLVPGQVPMPGRVDAYGNPVEERPVYSDVVVVGRAHRFTRAVYGTSLDPDDPHHPRWRLPGARYPTPSPLDPAFRTKGRR